MNIKLIASDIDGTLLNNQGKITPITRYVLEEASRQGILVAIASGRTKGAMSAILSQLPLPDYLIQSNGAAILDMKQDRILHSQFLSWEQLPEILELLSYYNIGFHCFIDSKPYMDIHTLEKYRWFCSRHHVPEASFLKFTCIDSFIEKLLEERPNIEKIATVTDNTDVRSKLMRDLKEIPGLEISSATWYNIEINDQLATKGNALEILTRKLSIDLSNVAAFGDNYNDLSMLKIAGCGVAMANSPKAILKAARHITFSNDENGVARFLASQLNININHFKH